MGAFYKHWRLFPLPPSAMTTLKLKVYPTNQALERHVRSVRKIPRVDILDERLHDQKCLENTYLTGSQTVRTQMISAQFVLRVNSAFTRA